MKRNNPRRALRFEQLEGRAMLAGTVTAIEYGPPGPLPQLIITGDNANNVIVIHETHSSNGAVMVQVQGIGTKIIGGFSFEDVNTTRTGTSFTFFSPVDVQIALGGGNDSLTIYNTNIPGTLTIDMGAGSDTLIMSNVHYEPSIEVVSIFEGDARPLSVMLGSGDDVAIMNNVSATGDISINSGSGRDIVTLNRVAAGMTGSNGTLSVQMGPGNSDILTVALCTANHATFNDTEFNNGLLTDSANGLLLRLRNHFSDEIDAGFKSII